MILPSVATVHAGRMGAVGPTRGGTILELRESGFASDEHYEDNSGGWTAELGELEAWLAT